MHLLVILHLEADPDTLVLLHEHMVLTTAHVKV